MGQDKKLSRSIGTRREYKRDKIGSVVPPLSRFSYLVIGSELVVKVMYGYEFFLVFKF